MRYVDWKVFGRTDKFYVKRFEDETNLTVYLLLDCSQSMAYQSDLAPWSKWQYAQCAAAALAWLAIQHQDAVGLGLFDRAITQWLEPSSSSTHLHPLLNILEGCEPTEPTAAAMVLQSLGQRLPRRGAIIVMSDLLDDPQQLLQGVRLLQQQRHEVSLLHVMDPAELEFPFKQPMMFHGLEGLGDLPVDANLLRDAYLRELHAHLNTMRRGCQAQGVHYCLARTDQALDAPLAAMLDRSPRSSAGR